MVAEAMNLAQNAEGTAALQALKRATERATRAGYYSQTRCPIHKQVVAIIDGNLIGRCSECAGEAARALLTITSQETVV